MSNDLRPAAVHWVLVADASRARIFESDLLFDALVPLEDRVHPASRVPVHDVVSDTRGAEESSVSGIHTRFDRHTDPHRATTDAFARELAAVVCAAHAAHRYDRLVVIAPAQFLGELRAHLDLATARSVIADITHEWTQLPPAELAERTRAAVTAHQLRP